MDFQRETLFDVIEEVQPLLDAHYEELCVNRDTVKLSPRWDVYAEMERLGCFIVLTAREGGKLAGYSAYFLQPHMHYSGFVVAQNDLFYVVDEYRKGAAALRFLRYCEREMKDLGAQKLVYHCKPQNNFAPILRRMGYADEEVMCAKLLS
jgi:hypothetical protein